MSKELAEALDLDPKENREEFEEQLKILLQ